MNINNKKSVSVIIPTLNAERELPALLNALRHQHLKADEIIVIDSASTDGTEAVCERDGSIRLIKIARNDFDHGRTRDTAMRKAQGDFVVFLTQDALPADDNMLGNLIKPLYEDKVAVSTGRQLPKDDAAHMERLVRGFNYPAESHIRSAEDLSRMGIKTFFCSDVCAAYNKDIYISLGGFEYPLMTNEDMFYAAKAINNGHRVAYAADAKVYHSHNFTLKEQFKRNYLQGYELARHDELLCNASQTSEGKKLVMHVTAELIKEKHPLSCIPFFFDCVARLSGNRLGKAKYLREEKGRK